MVTAVPIEQISGWMLGCASEVFTSFDELKAHLALQAALGAAL
jgi:hypothetical protein